MVVRVGSRGRVAEECEVRADVGPVAPELPAPMRVDQMVRIDLYVSALRDGVEPRVEMAFEGSFDGGAETGQFLESIGFDRLPQRLSLATRDACWMLESPGSQGFVPDRLREPNPTPLAAGWTVRHLPRGFVVTVGERRAGTVRYPLAAAFASSLPDADAGHWTWSAVDAALP